MHTRSFVIHHFILLAFLYSWRCQSDDSSPKCSPVAFVIQSQPARYDIAAAKELRESLLIKAKELHLKLNVFLTHDDFKGLYGAWAIWPILKRLHEHLLGTQANWIFFCEPQTEVDVRKLIDFLQKFPSEESHFIGRTLKDERPTIIHHFYGYGRTEGELLYVDFAAGVALSKGLIERIVQLIRNNKPRDFSIDPKHELAKLFRDALDVSAVDEPSFCLLENETNCITKYIRPTYKECGENVTNEDVYFAVKTFSGYYKTRIVVVKRTWAKTAKYVEYFSDTRDQYIPTIDLGINNTERGHCMKTLAILKYFLASKEVSKVGWLAVTDDDTLLSVPRLYRLLSCYDPKASLIVGERYGYGFNEDGQYGYDYPTGGAGMVFSRAAVQKLSLACHCPDIDSPDDMIIGMCARQLRIPIIHSAAFHQTRPNDYSDLYLRRIQPISFHKFEEIDPYKEYMEKLHEAGVVPASRPVHHEL